MERTTVLNKKERIPWRDFGGDVVIVDTQTLACLNLNETAGLIWHLIDGLNTCQDIINRIADAFDVDEEEAEKDFFQYAQALLDRGFINEPATYGAK